MMTYYDTAADRAHAEMLEAIQTAIVQVSKLAVEEVDDYSRCSDEYKENVRKTLADLLEIRARFKKC